MRIQSALGDIKLTEPDLLCPASLVNMPSSQHGFTLRHVYTMPHARAPGLARDF